MSEAPVVLDKDPTAARGYLRALLHARRPVRAPAAPRLAFERRGVRVPAGWLHELRTLFGDDRGGGPPLTLPHVLAGGLQLAVVTDPAFPLRILGAVHLKSEMEQLAPLPLHRPLRLRVSLGELRDVDKGTEHDLETELYDEDALLWRGTSTNLTLDPAAPRRPRGEKPPLPEGEHEAPLRALRDIGRRYGKVSGDRNPIHLSRVTAKAFGFPRAIAHGMWTVGRALALMGRGEGQPGDALQVRFKRPLFLPGQAAVRWTAADEQIDFWVLTEAEGSVHVEGALRRG